MFTQKLRAAARPILVAADQGHTAVVDFLLDQSSEKERFLFYCMQGDEARVQRSIRAKPDLVWSLTDDDLMVLPDMAWENKTRAVRVMLDAGFDVNAPGEHTSTPLDRAAYRGFKDLVELILTYDPDLEIKNEFGGTALASCIHGSVNMRDPRGDYSGTVAALIQAGANLPEKLGGSEAVQVALRKFGVMD